MITWVWGRRSAQKRNLNKKFNKDDVYVMYEERIRTLLCDGQVIRMLLIVFINAKYAESECENDIMKQW